MNRDSDIIIAKFKKELPEQATLYLRHGDKAVDMLSPRAIELAGAFEDAVNREEEIKALEEAPITQEQGQQVLRENPTIGKLATAASSLGRWMPGFGETLAVAGDAAMSGKSYDQAKKEQEVMLDSMISENPKTYAAGVAGGLLSGVFTPNLRSIPKLAALGAYEAGSQMPTGDYGGDELRSRLTAAGFGAGGGALGGKFANMLEGAVVGSQKAAAKAVRGIPEDISQEIITNPGVVDNVATQADAVADVVKTGVRNVEAKYGKLIGSVMEEADKAGKKVDFSGVVSEIDKDIAHYENIAKGDGAGDATAETIEFLKNIKKKFFSPSEKKSLTMYPEETVMGSRTVDVPVVTNPYKGPKDPYLEKRLGPSEVKMVQKTITEPQTIPAHNVSQTFRPDPYSQVGPRYSQFLKTKLKNEMGLFKGQVPGEEIGLLEKYAGMMGTQQRKVVPGYGVVEKGAVRESSQLPGDVWAKMQNKTIPDVSQTLFGTKSVPTQITSEDGYKAAKAIFDNKNKILDKLQQFLSPEELAQVVDDAKTIVVQKTLEESSVSAASSSRVANTAPLVFAVTPKYWAAKLLTAIGGMKISSPQALQTTGRTLKKLHKPIVGGSSAMDLINKSGRSVGTGLSRGIVE